MNDLPMTLDQWAQSTPEIILLKNNLQSNLDIMTDLLDEEKEDLMRYNLIMIRQFVESLNE